MRDFLLILKWRGVEGLRMLTRQERERLLLLFCCRIRDNDRCTDCLLLERLPRAEFLQGRRSFRSVKGADGNRSKTDSHFILFGDNILNLLGSDLPIVVSNLFFSERVEMLLNLPGKDSHYCKRSVV